MRDGDRALTVKYIESSILPTKFGEFTIHGFLEEANGKEHVAITFGDLSGDDPVLARIHSECLTGDALFSARCDCGPQLEEAMRRISSTGRGVILYLRQEGRGIGLMNKIKAYHLQDQGADTVEANEALGFDADQREYSMCQTMLDSLGVHSVMLMTNNPRKVAALKGYGINVVGRSEIRVGDTPQNADYLKTKRSKLGHLFDK